MRLTITSASLVVLTYEAAINSLHLYGHGAQSNVDQDGAAESAIWVARGQHRLQVRRTRSGTDFYMSPFAQVTVNSTCELHEQTHAA